MVKLKKGITLISLIITIVVTVVLTGTVVSILKEYGVIGKAEKAKDMQNKTQELELVEMTVLDVKLNSENFVITTENLENGLRNRFKENYGALTENDGWDYIGQFASYHISQKGIISVVEQIKNYIIYGNNGRVLPEGYLPVEYLESTGKQYIDTGYTNDGSCFNIKGKVKVLSYSNADSRVPFTLLFGNYSTNYVSVTFYIPANQKDGAIEVGSSLAYAVTGKIPVTLNELYDFDILAQNNKLTGHWGNKVLNNIYSGSLNKNHTFVLFGSYHQSYGYYAFAKMKLYNFAILDKNQNVVRNYIPCIKLDGKTLGLYDTANNKFYINQGEGSFLRGKIKGVGDFNDDGTCVIPLKVITTSGEEHINVILNSPLRKIGNIADCLDLINKEIVRYIDEDGNVLETPEKESISIENLPPIADIVSIEVETVISPSNI